MLTKNNNLSRALIQIQAGCNDCGKCLKDCLFLQGLGSPKQIAEQYLYQSKKMEKVSFGCSLCRLCKARCPRGLNPAWMFLEMRRTAAVQPEIGPCSGGGVLRYEKIGTSAMFSWLGLPKGSDAVFFPGCTFAGTRPRRTIQVYDVMRRMIPRMGIVLDCCANPSHDMGHQTDFESLFGKLRDHLFTRGIRTVYVTCPNCYKVFRQYGAGLKVKTVYEVLASNGLPAAVLPAAVLPAGTVAVHDPCPLRFEKKIHAEIRKLVQKAGLAVQPMVHEGERTICCGKGGDLGHLAPDLSVAWQKLRLKEAAPGRLVTYCAGCVEQYRAVLPVHHILDLLFDPRRTLRGAEMSSRAPFTYSNRLMLKRYFRKRLQPELSPSAADTIRRGTFGPKQVKKWTHTFFS